MKRLLCLLLAALTVLGLGACGEKSGAPRAETTFPTTASEEPKPLQTLPLETGETEQTETAPTTDTAESNFVDLTALSSTMVYAEVFAMMSSPEDYVGKTVKMQGIFSKGQLYAAGSLNDGGTVFASKNCMGKLWVPGTEKPKASLSLMGVAGSWQFLK